MEDQIGKSRKVLYDLESDKKLLAKTYDSALDFSYPTHPYSSYPEQIDFLFILTFIYFCLSDYIDLSFYFPGLALFSFFSHHVCLQRANQNTIYTPRDLWASRFSFWIYDGLNENDPQRK